jgi:hypothetical protein
MGPLVRDCIRAAVYLLIAWVCYMIALVSATIWLTS